VTVSTARKLKN